MGLFSLVTSIIGGNKQKKAAKKAAQVTQDVADKNNALALNIYGKNEGYLAPYAQMGNQASGAIMELLGFAPTQQPPQNALTPQAGTQYGGQFGGALLDSGQNFLPNGYYYGQQTAQPVAQTPPAPQPTAMSAFDRYRASDGYQFRQNEGMNALASNFRGRGVSQSGAADKALLRYGQDYGSNEFGKYLGYLSNQQGVGLSGASALAGVGQNYVNNVTANNNNAGNSLSNSLLARGNITANQWGQVGGFADDLVSSFFGGGGFGG